MGFFKEMKKLKETADAQPKVSLTDGMRQANEAIAGMQASQQLLVSGLDGSATITSVQATGGSINNFPEIQFDVMVSVGGHTPYQVSHRQGVSPVSMPHIQPGATVSVKVDPNDNSKIHILA